MHMEQNGAYNICIEIFFAEIITCTCPTKQQEQERNAVYDWRQETWHRRPPQEVFCGFWQCQDTTRLDKAKWQENFFFLCCIIV